MANRPAAYTQADVTRAVKGAIAAGLRVVEVVASKNGVRVVVETQEGSPASGVDTWSDLNDEAS